MNEVTNKEFNHIKIHTQYSICEGAIKMNVRISPFMTTNNLFKFVNMLHMMMKIGIILI